MAYVRQQAWLSTAPDKPEKGKKQDLPNLTYFEKLELKYSETELFDRLTAQPELPIEILLWMAAFQGNEDEVVSLPFELAHIWIYLLEVGPVGVGAMGSIPLSYLEIKAWKQTTSVHLSAWETVLLRKCSQEWISAQYQAKKPNGIPPWVSIEPLSDRRQRVSKGLKMALGGSVKKNKSKKRKIHPRKKK